jgi:hypothetical protein
MTSKIKVDQIAGSTGSSVTVPTGQTLTVTDGIAPSSLQTVTEVKGGTGQTTYTQGDILYASGANTLAKLAKGSAGQILQINSGATAPEWTTPATGNFVKISSGSISSGTSNLIFDNIFDSTDGYNRYVLKIDDLYGSTDAQVRFRYRIHLTDSNSTEDDTTDHYSGYWMAARGVYDGTGIYAYRDTRKAFGDLHEQYSSNFARDYLEFGGHYDGNSVAWMRGERDEANFWEFEFHKPFENANHIKSFRYEIVGRWSGSVGQSNIDNPAQLCIERGMGSAHDANLTSIRNLKGFKLYPTSGSFTSGEWCLYGIKR